MAKQTRPLRRSILAQVLSRSLIMLHSFQRQIRFILRELFCGTKISTVCIVAETLDLANFETLRELFMAMFRFDLVLVTRSTFLP